MAFEIVRLGVPDGPCLSVAPPEELVVAEGIGAARRARPRRLDLTAADERPENDGAASFGRDTRSYVLARARDTRLFMRVRAVVASPVLHNGMSGVMDIRYLSALDEAQ